MYELDSNADRCGLFSIGDVLMSISPSSSSSSSPSSTTSTSSAISVEALNIDNTLAEFAKFTDIDDITLTVRRLVKRKSINIEVYDPQGKFTGTVNYLLDLESLIDSRYSSMY
jgi:hypothetical protein